MAIQVLVPLPEKDDCESNRLFQLKPPFLGGFNYTWCEVSNFTIYEVNYYTVSVGERLHKSKYIL